jgi:4-amino-4-deoxy-L-arabinose transferase-like glycosyltransferase
MARRKRSAPPAQPAAPPPDPPPADSNVAPVIVVAIALLAFALLSLGNIVTSCATSDETSHIASGYTANRLGDFRINPEHPPLLKRIATLPLLAMNIWPYETGPADGTRAQPLLKEAWAMSFTKPISHWVFAQHWLYGVRDEALARNGATMLTLPTTVPLGKSDYLNSPDAMFTRARAMMILPALALGALIFVWSSSIWGRWGGALSALLFTFDPNFIGHTGLVTTDVGAALFMTATVYFFWRVCSARGAFWPNIVGFACAFGLAQISKYSAVLLIPIIAILALTRWRQWRPILIALGVGAVVTVTMIWAVYNFRFSAAPDPAQAIAEESEARDTLKQEQLAARDRVPIGRFMIESTIQEWAAKKQLVAQYGNQEPPFEIVRRHMPTAPVPTVGKVILFALRHELLPEGFLHGVSLVQLGSVTRSSYLHESYSATGFKSYFFWTTLYKLTIPALLIIGCGLVLAYRRRGDWLPFLAWPVLVYLGIAVVSAINIGHRHILPVFPFVYIACGCVVVLVKTRRAFAVAGTGVLLAVMSNVVFAWPVAPLWNRHLSYVNELAGGPWDSDEVVDSNIDWGQDLPRLAAWLRERKIDEPVNLIYFGTADPQYSGLRYINAPLGYYGKPEVGFDGMKVPGYVAISANSYRGIIFAEDSRDFWREYLNEKAERVGMAGYSIYVYRITERPRYVPPVP